MYIATASEQGTIIRVHLISEATKSYSFRRGAYPSTIFSLSFGPSTQFPDVLVATSSSGSVHAFSLGLGMNQRSRRSSSFFGSIIPDSVNDVLDPAHHVLHNVVPAGVKSYAVIRKVDRVPDTSISESVAYRWIPMILHSSVAMSYQLDLVFVLDFARATVSIITYSGSFQEYTLIINQKNESSWHLERRFDLLTAISDNIISS
ncbi:Autophagy-related protein 18b [Vitis vinifera]|uniref:Autophagy-related protein 18b n=1 Tax=Vitis vinifera TaxID=29760 RepID=A0A438HVF5_VITVI|nr:Autophagy-related protein 18b [Vitis vinifera]